jgi:hypothetical protein
MKRRHRGIRGRSKPAAAAVYYKRQRQPENVNCNIIANDEDYLVRLPIIETGKQ